MPKRKIESKVLRAPAEAIKLLERLRSRFSKRAGVHFLPPQTLTTALHLADVVTTEEYAQRLADLVTAQTNKNTVGIIKQLMGEEVQVERSADGTAYTFTLREKSLIVADNSADLRMAFGRRMQAELN